MNKAEVFLKKINETIVDSITDEEEFILFKIKEDFKIIYRDELEGIDDKILNSLSITS